MLKKLGDILMKILVIITIALGLIAMFKPDLIKNFIDWIRQIVLLLGYWNYLIVFLSSIIESFPVLGVVVPGQNILLIVGGFFGEISKENLIYVIIITSIGSIIGNYIGFYLGKHYGDKFFKEYGLWFGIGETEVKYMKKGIEKWGMWGIVFGKFHNLTRAFVPFIAGTMGMRTKNFFIYNIIGSIIWSVFIIILGVLFAKVYEQIIDYLPYILIGIMFIVGIYVWKYKKKEFMKYMQEKNEEIESKM